MAKTVIDILYYNIDFTDTPEYSTDLLVVYID